MMRCAIGAPWLPRPMNPARMGPAAPRRAASPTIAVTVALRSTAGQQRPHLLGGRCQAATAGGSWVRAARLVWTTRAALYAVRAAAPITVRRTRLLGRRRPVNRSKL
jgi:hypothetical protein